MTSPSKHLPAARPPGVPAPVMPRARTPAADSDDPGPDWRRVSAALWHYKWVVFLCSVLGIAGGIAATRALRPTYIAQATVWIDVPDNRREPDRAGPIRQGGLLTQDAWIDLLRSYVVLDHVVREQRLYLELMSIEDTARFAGFGATDTFRPGQYVLTVDDAGRNYVLSAAKGADLQRGTVGDSVGKTLGFQWAPTAALLPPGRKIEFTLATPRDAALRLGERLDVRMDLNGNFLSVELRGSNPRQIANILNSTTARFVQVAGQLKREKLTELTKILQDQRAYAQRGLDDAEAALKSFRMRTITLPSDQSMGGTGSPGTGTSAPARDPVIDDYFQRQFERDQLGRDRANILRVLTQTADSGLPVDAFASIASVQRSPELANALKELSDKQAQLRTYRYHYSDAYPLVQRLLGEIAELERRTIPTLAQALVAQLAQRAKDLSKQVDVASRDLRQIPARSVEEARLRRAVQLAEESYNTVQGRFLEATLAAEASSVPDVRILDPAVVPQRPVKNTAPRLLLMGLVAGLGLGVVGAVLLDRLDPRVRYPEQVSRDLGLPILGALPHLRRDQEPSEVVEALRGLCLNLVHAYGAAGPMLVTVTSPGPGDGKSFLAANLALTFADGGHRTLLIDGDIRRGVLHRRFKAARQPGLTDYLREEATRDQVIQSTAYPWLSFVGCGTRSHRAPELLGSPAMNSLISGLRQDYDVILIDSPPLGAGVDPFILGTATGHVLLVLRTGYSHREMTEAKLEVLDRLPVRTLGAVLNDVPRGSGAGYYAYYSYHLPGYEAVDEDTAARPRLV
ncbi:MAG TPA: polysaccharide biosynthesis tyrosine autokinase [Gemmatimonadales bacterium]|nr:polysaccharide biosynthesis tyrosine autokinase [Gemmatimonadales bacterium]